MNMNTLVRHNGRTMAIAELTGAEIASALTTGQRAKMSAMLGVRAGPAASGKPGGTRLQVVAHAVANDDACKGKAHLALAMLADDDLASVPGSGIVKLLRTAPSAAGNDADKARAEMQQMFGSGRYRQDDPNRPGNASSSVTIWDRAIALNAANETEN